jgi:hypothetical protein
MDGKEEWQGILRLPSLKLVILMHSIDPRRSRCWMGAMLRLPWPCCHLGRQMGLLPGSGIHDPTANLRQQIRCAHPWSDRIGAADLSGVTASCSGSRSSNLSPTKAKEV